jgi:hypothetical protein
VSAEVSVNDKCANVRQCPPECVMGATVTGGWCNNPPASAGVRDECDSGQRLAQQSASVRRSA